MIISINIQPLCNDHYTGIASYGYNLLKNLIGCYTNDTIYLNYFGAENLKSELDVKFNNGHESYTINNNSKISEELFRALSLIMPLNYSKYFEQEVDISYFFSFFLPRKVKGKCIFTIHDMVNKIYPETVKLSNIIALNLELKRSAQRADRIITVSESTKRDIIKYLKVPKEKISIIPPAYDNKIFHNQYNDIEIKNCLNKYNINSKYILYLGTIEPRKNLVRLIQAYYKAFNSQSDAPLLVLAGGKGWKYKSIFKEVKKLKLEDQVIFTGYVSQEDAPLLMNGAEFFAFPSLYEGFGMPCLEAMACGAPVLTSNVSSMPEVVGDAGVLVDPLSVDDITEKLKILYYDKKLRLQCINKGLEQCELFSWKSSAEKLYKVFQEVSEI